MMLLHLQLEHLLAQRRDDDRAVPPFDKLCALEQLCPQDGGFLAGPSGPERQAKQRGAFSRRVHAKSIEPQAV